MKKLATNLSLKKIFSKVNAFNKKKGSQGFSLLEILVSFGIITILTGVSLVGFSNYNKVQQMSQTATNIELMISQARNNARSVVKQVKGQDGNEKKCDYYGLPPVPPPPPVAQLVSYYVEVNDVNDIELHMVCVDDNMSSAPNPNDDILIRTLSLPDGTGFTAGSTCNRITFESLYADSLTGELPCDFIFENASHDEKKIKVDDYGNVEVE